MLLTAPRTHKADWRTCPEAASRKRWVALLFEAYGHVQAGGLLSDVIPKPTLQAVSLFNLLHREIQARDEQEREMRSSTKT